MQAVVQTVIFGLNTRHKGEI